MSNSILKKSACKFRAVGLLNETTLTRKAGETAIYENGQPTGKKVPCEVISGTVSLLDKENNAKSFNVYISSVGFDGKTARTWNMAQSMLKWEPKINGTGGEPTVVALEGDIAINDYVNRENELKSGLRWNVRYGNTRVGEGETWGTSLSIRALLGKIAPEVVNENETGRLKITFWMGGGKGACFPVNAFVDADSADDFDYEVGQTSNFGLDVKFRNVGGAKTTAKKKFGKGTAIETNSGYTIEELIVVSGDEVIEEPEELTDDEGNTIEDKSGWIDPKIMKKAITEREVHLEDVKKKGYLGSKNDSSKSVSAVRGASAKAKKKIDFDFDEEDF